MDKLIVVECSNIYEARIVQQIAFQYGWNWAPAGNRMVRYSKWLAIENHNFVYASIGIRFETNNCLSFQHIDYFKEHINRHKIYSYFTFRMSVHGILTNPYNQEKQIPEKYAIHCSTKNLFIDVQKRLFEMGYAWSSGETIVIENLFDKNKCCLGPNFYNNMQFGFASRTFYLENGLKIIAANKFLHDTDHRQKASEKIDIVQMRIAIQCKTLKLFHEVQFKLKALVPRWTHDMLPNSCWQDENTCLSLGATEDKPSLVGFAQSWWYIQNDFPLISAEEFLNNDLTIQNKIIKGEKKMIALISKNYPKTDDALLVEKHGVEMGILNTFICELVVTNNKAAVLNEAQRLETEEKNMKRNDES